MQSEEWSLTWWGGCPYEKRRRHQRSLFIQAPRKGHVTHTEKEARIWHTGTLISDIQHPELWAKKFLFSSHPTYAILLLQLELKYILFHSFSGFWWFAGNFCHSLIYRSITPLTAFIFIWHSPCVCLCPNFPSFQGIQSYWMRVSFYFCMTSFKLIVSTMTLLPKKVTFWSPRGRIQLNS